MNRKRESGNSYSLRETLKRQGGTFYSLRETLKRQGGSFYSLRETYHGIWKTSLLVGREVKYSRLMHYLKPGIIVCFIVWVVQSPKSLDF
jgi:hypothetical protein